MEPLRGAKEWKPIDYSADRLRIQVYSKKLVSTTQFRTALRDAARKLGTPRKFTHLIGPLQDKVRDMLEDNYAPKQLDAVQTSAMRVARRPR